MSDFNNVKIHVRLHQRSARSFVTYIENLPRDKLLVMLKYMKKKMCCNGSIKEDIIHLSGDQREYVKKILIESTLYTEDDIIIHGI